MTGTDDTAAEVAGTDEPQRPIWLRLLVTIALLVAVVVASKIRLPGLYFDGFGPSGFGPPEANFGIFIVGIRPALSAYFLVEVVSLLPVGLRAKRHEPRTRARLVRAAMIGSVLLAVGQAFGIVTYVEAVGGFGDRLLVLATTTAAFCVLLMIAHAITRQGWVNGIVALFVLDGAFGPATPERVSTSVELGMPVKLGLAALALLVLTAAVLAAGGRALASAQSVGAKKGDGPYRDTEGSAFPLALPVPASGLWPILIAVSLAALPTTLNDFVPIGDVATVSTGFVPGLALVVLVGAGLAMLFTRVGPVSAEIERLGGVAPPEQALRALRLRAVVWSVVFLVALYASDHLLAELGWAGVAFPFVLGMGLLADAVRWVRAEVENGPLVPVAEERRPYAALAAANMAGQRGLVVHLHGACTGTFYTFFGPFAPMTLLAPRADAARVSALLAGDRRDAETETETEATPSGGPVTTPGAFSMPRPLLLGAAAVVSLSLLAAPDAVRQEPDVAPVTLELVAVDDEVELFDQLALADDLPEGFDVRVEIVSFGTSSQGAVRYVVAEIKAGDTPEKNLERARAWAKGIELPAGRRIAWGPLYESVDIDVVEHRGWRSFVLGADPIVTHDDVADATAQADGAEFSMGASVNVQFSPEGGRAFQQATARLVKRRLAIVVDGVVESAPIVQEEIPGGTAVITTGARGQDGVEEARRLAAALRAARPR